MIIFGSSVNDSCGRTSDVDVYFEKKQHGYPVKNYLPYKYDFWDNYSVDECLYKEIINKGVVVYECMVD